MPGTTTEDTKVKPDPEISEEEKDLEAPDAEPTPDQEDNDPLADIDLDRAVRDEDYLAEVNEKLEKGEPAEKKDEGELEGTGREKPEEKTEDPVVGKGIYNGEEFEIRDSEKVALWQKGRHLDKVVEEYGPAITAMKQNPELRKVLQAAHQSPKLADAVLEAARRIYAGTGEGEEAGKLDLSDVEGVDPDDAEVFVKMHEAVEKKKYEAEQERLATEGQERERRSGEIIQSLKMVDPMFPKVQELMRKRMAEEPVFKDPRVMEALDNPFMNDPQTDRPYFFSFYDETRNMLNNNGPGEVPRKKEEVPPAPKGASDRIGPGGDRPPAGSAGKKDYSRMSDADFEAEINRELNNDD